MREADGVHRAHGILVLTIAASRVTRSTMFMDPALLTTFGQPPALPTAGDIGRGA
jgi:RNA polymerase sigma-70 factor (ECF subfamily)